MIFRFFTGKTMVKFKNSLGFQRPKAKKIDNFCLPKKSADTLLDSDWQISISTILIFSNFQFPRQKCQLFCFGGKFVYNLQKTEILRSINQSKSLKSQFLQNVNKFEFPAQTKQLTFLTWKNSKNFANYEICSR